MTTFLEATNLIAACIYVVIVVLVLAELRRLSIGFPPIVVVLVAYFAVRVVDLLAAPDPILGYSAPLDAVTDIAVIALLLYLLAHARRLARLALVTISEAQLRLAEYERARRDYALVVHSKLAGPLSVISGAAQSLRTVDDPKAREELEQLIADSSAALRQISNELSQFRDQARRDGDQPDDEQRAPDSG